MRFLILLKCQESTETPPASLMEAIFKLGEEQTKTGTLLDTGGLAPNAQSARVRLADGKISVTDGPFTESKELIASYAMFELNSREEAVQAAKDFLQLHKDHWPGWEGESEIRQVFGPGDFPFPG